MIKVLTKNKDRPAVKCNNFITELSITRRAREESGRGVWSDSDIVTETEVTLKLRETDRERQREKETEKLRERERERGRERERERERGGGFHTGRIKEMRKNR